jgi:hypothetical protein
MKKRNIVSNSLPLLKRPDNRVIIPTDPEVEPHLALFLRGCKTGDDIIGRDAGILHAIERKEDCLHQARLARAVIPEDAGDAVVEFDLLVPEAFEVLELEAVEDHGAPPKILTQKRISLSCTIMFLFFFDGG